MCLLCAPSFLVLLRVCGTFARRRSFLQLAPLLSVQSLYAARELPAEASNVEGLIDVTNNAFETLRKQCIGLTPWLSWQCLPFFISDPGDCCCPKHVAQSFLPCKTARWPAYGNPTCSWYGAGQLPTALSKRVSFGPALKTRLRNFPVKHNTFVVWSGPLLKTGQFRVSF